MLLPRWAEPAGRGAGVGSVVAAAVTRAELGETGSPLELPLKCGCPGAPLRSAERQAAVVARARGRQSGVQGFARGEVLYHQFVRLTPEPPTPVFFLIAEVAHVCL